MSRISRIPLGVFLLLGLANFSKPASAGLTGATIAWQYYYNGGADNVTGASGSFVVNGNVGGMYAPSNEGSKAVFSIAAADSSVTFNYAPDQFGSVSWMGSPLSLSPTIHNGIALNFTGATIASVKIDPVTNMAGFNLGRVSFTGNQIQVDWQGLAFNTNTVVKLDINQLSVSGGTGHVASDFDGNGVPDLVWQNSGNGQVIVHYYGGAGGATLQNWSYLNETGVTGWQVVAVADFDGDGHPDLVWQDESTRRVTVSYYGGAGGAVYQARWAWLDQTGTPGWHVVAAADFNGDGVPDLVWQSDTTGQVTVHYYGGAGGAVLQSWNWLNKDGVTGWHVAAAADFNQDGVPDLVWENDTTHQVTVHYYGGSGGATLQSWNWLNQDGVTGWHVAGARDFNADGVPDLIWQNDSTGQVTVHYYGGSGGATLESWKWLQQTAIPGWTTIDR